MCKFFFSFLPHLLSASFYFRTVPHNKLVHRKVLWTRGRWCFSPDWEMMRQFETEGAQWGRRWGKDMKWMNKKTIFSWQLLGNIFHKSVTSICTTKENLKLLQVLFRAHFSFLNPCWEGTTWIITFTAPVCYSLYVFYCLLAKMSMRGHAPTVSLEPFFNSACILLLFHHLSFFFSCLLLPPSRPLSWNDTLQMLCCERWVMNGRQGNMMTHVSVFIISQLSIKL